MTRRADEVLRLLRHDIVSGVHSPGARLTESSLTSAYGVSRVPVREALRHLEVEGFVTARAYAGVSVARMHVDEAVDLFTVRRTIEQLTVKRCARRFRRTPDAEAVRAFGDRLTSLVTAGCEAARAEDRAGLPPLNTEFHLSLADFADNASLATLLRQVAAKIEWLYTLDVDVRGPHSWAEHAEIAKAVRAGHGAEAARLMGRHVGNSLDGYLLRHSPARDGDGDRDRDGGGR